MIVFISISKWRGLKYSKSSDPKTRMIGIVAWVLLILSTIFLFWLTWYETIKLQEAFQTSMDQMNKDLKSMGF
jgi:cobalamin biosynthesis protein CobD/CbiB